MLRYLADVAQNISVILTCAFAVYGIDSWRREFVGKRRMELAEEVLALFYQASDAIEAMRSPFGYGGEGNSRKPSESESPDDKEALDHAFRLVERYNRHAELFARLFALRYRFMAQLGVDAAEPFDALSRVVNELIHASRKMSRRVTKRERERVYRDASQAEKLEREMAEIEAVFYSGSENDPIEPRVKAIVAAIERTCKGIIESRGTLFAAVNLRVWGRR